MFCANKEHMDEMVSHVPEWFAGVNPDVVVYEAYLGNGMMVSAGDPIKHANIHSSYWEKHLAGFGRLSK